MERKKCLAPRQCTVSQVDKSDGKNNQIARRIPSTYTVFTRFGSQQLLSVRIPQRNACRMAIELEWRGEEETYFADKGNLFYKKGSENME